MFHPCIGWLIPVPHLVSCLAEAVPKRILDLMNVEGLTRENVASHLQVSSSPVCHSREGSSRLCMCGGMHVCKLGQ